MRRPLFVLIASLAVFAAASAGLSGKVEPFCTWYFSFAWWPAILATQAAVKLKGGRSTLFDDPRLFATLLPLSLTIWLVFEALNFRLGNWSYLNLPRELHWRWLGYALSFSSVLPALTTAADLLEHTGLFARSRCKPLVRPDALRPGLLAAGTACLVLPLMAPRLFFPLVWGAFVFLLEPWLHRHGGDSLLSDLESGRPRRPLLLLASGLLCGFFWEMWNFRAGARWVYDIPLPAGPKVFEMPLLGFLGFPAFALECFCLTSAFFILRRRVSLLSPGTRRLAWAALILGAAAFDVWVMRGIDSWTMIS
ncbi:hypothetical protein M7784_08260 [Desulfovibrio aminophilus]|nr:hypothetical protein [Desulfovibrio aminophilus]MCM0755240.1 hypothetical protein [Desulfovibrio aminophilus]